MLLKKIKNFIGIGDGAIQLILNFNKVFLNKCVLIFSYNNILYLEKIYIFFKTREDIYK